MSNLRRQALESKKTVSRKARARLEAASLTSSPTVSPGGSRAGSRAGSRTASRNASRHGSGDEAEDDDIAVQLSEVSIDHTVSMADRLSFLVGKMADRDFFKGSEHGRAVLLTVYANLLSDNYFDEEDQDKIEDAYPVLARCLKEGNAAEPSVHAIRCVALTAITCGDDSGMWFTRTKDILKTAIYDSSGVEGQVTAIHALGMAAYFGGADYPEIQSVLDTFIEIIDNGGTSDDSGDSSDIVAAAIQAWGFLSTFVEESGSRLGEALTSFETQLQNSNPDVLIATAENIALIYEQCYVPKDWKDRSDLDKDVGGADSDDMVHWLYKRKNWTKVHEIGGDITGDDYDIKTRLKELSRSTMRYVKKDTRKELHSVLRDVVHSLDYPWRGPHYSTAIDDETVTFYGHRLRQGNMLMDRWWKLHRYDGLKHILQDGSLEHLSSNPNFDDVLRNCLQPTSRFIHSSDVGNALQDDRRRTSDEEDEEDEDEED